MAIDQNRIEAFKSALLNTCVRAWNIMYPDYQLNLLNCKENKQFCKGAFEYLETSLFHPSVETAMTFALSGLRNELFKLGQ